MAKLSLCVSLALNNYCRLNQKALHNSVEGTLMVGSQDCTYNYNFAVEQVHVGVLTLQDALR